MSKLFVAVNFSAVVVAFVLVHCVALAQSGVVSGLVTDRTTAEPLVGVSVRIVGTQLGGVTNKQGRFSIKGISLGKIELEATLIGYETSRLTAFIRNDGQQDVVFTMLQTSIRTNEVVISASRRVQAVQDVPISIATIDQNDLARRNVVGLDEALRYVSGINVVRDQINIRGSSGFAFGVGSRTMVLLDGFPVISGDNGDIKFDVLPVADVQRIEVIKGAGSALYGTGALGGVVSMITKKPQEGLSFTSRAYGGAFTAVRHDEWIYRDTPPSIWGADARVTHSQGNLDVSLSGGIRSDESYRDFDRSLRGFGYGKIQWRPSYSSTFSLASLYATNVNENFIYWQDLRHATIPSTTQNQDERLSSDKLALYGEWLLLINSQTSLTIRPGMFKTHFENQIGGETLDSNSSTAYAWNTDVLITSIFSPEFTLTGGLTGKLNHVRADVYGQQVQALASAFAQGEFTLPHNIIVTAGVRADLEGTKSLPNQLEFSPKLGVSWGVTEEVHMRASVGRGFRAATIAERYANIRYGPFNVQPNPDILPESSWSSEIGVLWKSSSWIFPFEIDLSVFDNELFDLIEPTFDVNDPDVPIHFLNVTRARIIGSELTVRAALSKSLRVESGLTAMLPQDLVLNETLKYRNNILWYSRVMWNPIADIEIQGEYRFQNRVENIDDKLTLFIPDADARVPIHVVDVRVFWTLDNVINQPLRIGLIGRNILDYYYAEVVANLSPTRSILLQAEWSLANGQ